VESAGTATTTEPISSGNRERSLGNTLSIAELSIAELSISDLSIAKSAGRNASKGG
jgi:hypothetical protein